MADTNTPHDAPAESGTDRDILIQLLEEQRKIRQMLGNWQLVVVLMVVLYILNWVLTTFVG